MTEQQQQQRQLTAAAAAACWENPAEEWVLLVPPKLAKSSHAILAASDCLAKPWHLQGRYGSRTHKHIPCCQDDDNGNKADKVAIPVLSRDIVLHQCTKHDALNQLLSSTNGVELVYKAYTISFKALNQEKIPLIDGRIHPERAPPPPSPSHVPSNSYSSRPPSRISSSSASAASTSAASSSSSKSASASSSLFTYIELFAGIGGFAVALDALGGECVLACEIEEACRHVYRHNFPAVNLLSDIYDISNDRLLQLQQSRLLHGGQVVIDLLVGGFPCQPFSALGQQPGLSCPKGHLFLEIVRFLQILQPKAFILENVPGLLTMHDTFHVILQALQDAGYVVSYEVCNARGLTATCRKRLFIIGLRQTRTTIPSRTTTSPFEFPYIPDLKLQSHHVLSYNVHNSNGELTALDQQILPISDSQLQQLQGNSRWRPGKSSHLAWPQTKIATLVSHYGNAVGRGDSQLVPSLAATTTTINTTTGGSITTANNGDNPRRFSPRECLRLMGFPVNTTKQNKKDASDNANSNDHNGKYDDDDLFCFRLPPKDAASLQGDMAFYKQQYRMIGNAVCPPLIAALAGAVLDRILVTTGAVVPEDTQSSSSSSPKSSTQSASECDHHVSKKQKQSDDDATHHSGNNDSNSSIEDIINNSNYNSNNGAIVDWVDHGRRVAVELAYRATLNG